MAPIAEALRPVDRVDVTLIVDLMVNVLLPSAGPAVRPVRRGWAEEEQLRAEHGYSLLVQTWIGAEAHTLLFDAGLTPTTFEWNLDALEIRPNEVEAILLSHGHADHHGGLEAAFRRYGRAGLPITLHPDARLTRRVTFPSGATFPLPPPSLNDLEREGANVLDERGPTLWGAGTMLLSGEVERTSSYETGHAAHQRLDNDAWVPDPLIWDDQNLVVNVRGRGLVVMSPCSHAGPVNVMHHARRLTGEERIHAFIGGMHLTGPLFERIVPATIDDIAVIAPDYLVPGHCTGHTATAELVIRFPERFLAPSVGSRYTFASPQIGSALDASR